MNYVLGKIILFFVFSGENEERAILRSPKRDS